MGPNMHDALIAEVLTDCIAYSDHNAESSILDKWSKEQLAFALRDMAMRQRVLKTALRAKEVPSEKLETDSGTTMCPVCRRTTPHHHDIEDAELIEHWRDRAMEAWHRVQVLESQREWKWSVLEGKLLTVLRLADELTVAVDNEAEDIGGQRPSGVIVKELGTAVDAANDAVTKAAKELERG